jgi:hypothetical protein
LLPGALSHSWIRLRQWVIAILGFTSPNPHLCALKRLGSVVNGNDIAQRAPEMTLVRGITGLMVLLVGEAAAA